MAKKKPTRKKTKPSSSRSLAFSITDLPGKIAFLLDSQYRYVSFSALHAATMKKIWGVTIKKGHSMLDYILSPADQAKAKRNFDAALKGKHFSKIEQYGDPEHLRTTYQDHYGPLKNKTGKVIGLYVWVLDLTQYKSAELTASKFSAILSSSLNSVDQGILIIDMSGRVIFKNQKFFDLWGFQAESQNEEDDNKLMTYALQQLVDPEGFKKRVAFLYEHVEIEDYDSLHLLDGRVFSRFSKPHYHGKKIIGRVWSFRDITNELNQQRQLLEWKNRYELIVSSFGRVVYEYLVPSGQIIWSGNISEILGYDGVEMGDINRWTELIHPDDKDEALRLLDIAQQNVSKYEVTYRFNSKHSGYIWLRDIGFFIAGPLGDAVRMVGEMTDISKQVEADREIRHLASFPMHSPDVILELDKNLALTYGNPAFYEAVRRLGITDHTPFIHKELLSHKAETGAWKTTGEVIVSGRTYNLKIFYLPEKERIRIYAFDLTDRLEAERQKADLEHTYQNLFESATDSIMLLDPDENPGKIISANPASATMYGYSMAELLNLKIQDLDVISTPNQITYEDRAKRIAQEKRQVFEVTHKKKDGTVFPLEVVASLFNLSGKRLELVFMRDISQRKKAEEEIKMQYRFIESLSSASPNVIYVYDVEEGKYVYANERMAEAYGYPLSRLLAEGHTLMRMLLHPDDSVKISDWISQVQQAQDGEVIESRFRLMKADGGWLTFHSREAVLLRKPNGEVKQYIGTSIDITQQVEAEEALRESEQRFRTLHEASFGGIAIHDNGKILECNAGLSAVTGFTYEELIGYNGLHLIHADDRALVLHHIQNQFEYPYDVRGIKKDGSIYNIQVQGKSVPYEGRSLRITEFRDITERVKATEKIIEQNARLQSIAENLKFKNEQLDEFTQIVSHNLRAPAGNIVSLSNFLAHEQDAEEQAKILELLKHSGNNILTTLSELNEVLKIKQSKNVEKQLLRFADVHQKASQMLNAQIIDTHANLLTDFSEAEEIEYPHIYLESIFLNLMSNALKYYDTQRPLRITIKTIFLDGRICLEVADTGLGINLERYGHQIFKMRKTFHNHPDSRGIGLFMIKNQVEAMGGTITVTSREGEGTAFRVIF